MDLKWEPGGAAPGPDGLPQRVDGLDEALQNIAMRLWMVRGSFPYQPSLGSSLGELDPQEENSQQRAWALAGEALLDCPGVRVNKVLWDTEKGMWQLWVTTPQGSGTVTAPGKEEADGEL